LGQVAADVPERAYRLIEAWPLAERLSPIGGTLNESQIRELLPLAGRHGQDAAVTVYRTVTETDGVQVTAALLRQVVGVLPADHFDPADAADASADDALFGEPGGERWGMGGEAAAGGCGSRLEGTGAEARLLGGIVVGEVEAGQDEFESVERMGETCGRRGERPAGERVDPRCLSEPGAGS